MTTLATFHGRPMRIGVRRRVRRWAMMNAASKSVDFSRFFWSRSGMLMVTIDDRQVFTGWELAEVQEL